MKKFNELYNKIISESNYEWDKVRPIFEKEAPELINKLNVKYRNFGLESYYSLKGGLIFSDGYKQRTKLNVIGYNKGKQWWEWDSLIEGTETKNLIYKGGDICLKSTWRPTSHRGQIVNWNKIGWDKI